MFTHWFTRTAMAALAAVLGLFVGYTLYNTVRTVHRVNEIRAQALSQTAPIPTPTPLPQSATPLSPLTGAGSYDPLHDPDNPLSAYDARAVSAALPLLAKIILIGVDHKPALVLLVFIDGRTLDSSADDCTNTPSCMVLVKALRRQDKVDSFDLSRAHEPIT